MDKQSPSGMTRRNNLITALILFLICVFSYSNTLQNGFLLDDHDLLLGENTFNNTSFKTLFLWGFKTAYRPVAFSLLKLELAAFGEDPAGYHIVNIILFGAICYLFYWILMKLTKNFTLSLLTVCLFASHPINNFLVNYKTAGCLSVYILLMQIAFLLFIFYLERKQKMFYGGSLLAYFLCLLSHEIAFILPVYLFLLAFLLKKNTIKESILLCLPFVGIFGLFLFIRMQVISASLITSVLRLEITLEQYVASLLNLIYWYNSKIFIPKDILFIWDEKIIEQSINTGMLLAFICVICVWVISIVGGRGSIKTFALSFYLAGFIPMTLSSFTYTHIMDTAMVEPHWFVFSSIGMFLLVVSLLSDANEFFNGRRAVFVIVMIMALTLSFTTRVSNAAWKDDATYCKYWMDRNHLNGVAYICRAKAFIKNRDRGPEPRMYTNCRDVADLAGTYHLAGKDTISLQYYLAALKIDPECVPAFFGLGNFYMDNEKYQMAEGAFQTMIAIAPNKREAYAQLIKVYEKLGKTKEAERLQLLLDGGK